METQTLQEGPPENTIEGNAAKEHTEETKNYQ
jgi:hypothetical protein